MRWLLLLAALIMTLPVLAQESTAEPSPAPTAITYTRDADLEIAVLRAEQAADTAEQSVNISGNLLNLFDGIALIMTVGGVLLGFFGLRSIQDTRSAGTELRKEAAQLRTRFDNEIEKREQEMTALRVSIEDSARLATASIQKRTDNALLALSLLEQGERQYRATDYDGAIRVYRSALELDPDNPFIHQRLGYVYCQQSEVDEALHHYSVALSYLPDFAAAIAGMGFVTRRVAERLPEGVAQDLKYIEAEQHLLRALTLSPRLVDDDGESWWGVLGGLYRRRGYLDKAINAYGQATQVTPQSSYGYGNLALLYMKRGQRDLMEETYARMERIAAREAIATSGNFWGYADLVVSRLALGMDQQALDDLKIAINIAPRNADWMLEGLRDTLLDLEAFLSAAHQPAVATAISSLNSALTAPPPPQPEALA